MEILLLHLDECMNYVKLVKSKVQKKSRREYASVDGGEIKKHSC
ncbi:hypothetical protein [Clostridium sporogenes]|nr:hypothetical protein [Clostridium sporogenes]